MNRDSDIEMESLLRRYARHGAKSPANAQDARAKLDTSQTNAAHMDADELSAYAEGALPDAARSRYASHLADCDSCRKIVTQLVISSGIATEERSEVVQTIDAPARSWREWLTALFTPQVLRYAVPALALFAVITIALIVATRNRDENNFVAKNEPQQQGANTATRVEQDGAATTETTAATDNQGTTTATANTSAASRNTSTATTQAEQKDVAPGATPFQLDGVANAPAPSTGDAPSNDRRELRDQERTADATKTEQPVQASPPTDTLSDRAKDKEKDDASLAAQKKQREGGGYAVGGAGAAAPSAAGRRNRASETASSTAPGSSTESANEEKQKNQTAKSTPSTATGRARRDTAGADEDSGESTRVVAGIRFRQRNGIWVDTNYSSSRPLSKVQRGSERYRALVADEPVIGTVANQLGNVIVVVKGRAYHIY